MPLIGKECNMEEKKLALQCDELDNVATIFANGVTAGMDVVVRDKKGSTTVIKVLDNVPYGHKIAIADIREGEHIMKYGESIGAATRDIPRGDYVHVHNLMALRGRGDI